MRMCQHLHQSKLEGEQHAWPTRSCARRAQTRCRQIVATPLDEQAQASSRAACHSLGLQLLSMQPQLALGNSLLARRGVRPGNESQLQQGSMPSSHVAMLHRGRAHLALHSRCSLPGA